MLTYPQFSSALAQFPLRKRSRQRTIVNSTADGGSIKLNDPGAQITSWQLQYTEMSDTELAALQQFFAATEGSLNGFTFLDPTGNLLAWSEVLTNAVWKAGPLLQVQGGGADPMGANSAWHLTNTGAGAQSLEQTLNGPAGYLFCFSLYVRANQTTTVILTIGANRNARVVGADWTRVSAVAHGAAEAESITFGIEVPAGVSIDIFGPQAEPQASASRYKVATTGGVYEAARFRDDEFSFTTTAPNRHSATVNIIHANHL